MGGGCWRDDDDEVEDAEEKEEDDEGGRDPYPMEGVPNRTKLGSAWIAKRRYLCGSVLVTGLSRKSNSLRKGCANNRKISSREERDELKWKKGSNLRFFSALYHLGISARQDRLVTATSIGTFRKTDNINITDQQLFLHPSNHSIYDKDRNVRVVNIGI